jgi:phosphatidylglycerol:prolipoprotein diacylglycerol transferase
MIDLLHFIRWEVSPDIVQLGPFTLRWYGLLFASGFLLGQQIMIYIFKKEGKPIANVESLTLYMVAATVLGARLGHCLFYDPEYYLSNPIEILKVWEGGLASHGATIGILIGLYLYSRKHPDQPWLWILDRVVITVALGGALIRMGNLFNSEIYGLETDLPWGFIFVLDGETVPRHPTQIYEALFCIVLLIITYLMWSKYRGKLRNGVILSVFVVLLFTFRFFIEFLKMDQVAFEENMTLNMGQWLSIPAVAFGLALYQYIQWTGRRAQGD